jgi:HK97 family phage portal protein
VSFWTRVLGRPNFEDETPNTNPSSDVGAPGSGYNPGDPEGVITHLDERRSSYDLALPYPQASPWSGWPGEWSTPDWSSHLGLHKLIDVAWAALDLNASVLSSFPVYRLKNGQILSPPPYLFNPDPLIYTSWAEFAKQLFWDYQLGEAFVLPFATGADGYPKRFRVIPPWLMNVELRNGGREYRLGNVDVTDDILHIRYISNTADARGHGPLEAAGARMITAGLLQRYAERIAQSGGTPAYVLEVDRTLTQPQADDMLDTWVRSRARHAGEPAISSGGAKLNQLETPSARDMTLLELSQFSEARIAVMLGVPPFLLGLPMSQGESITYSNASTLFDYHERASLGPKSEHVMQAMSGWLLPSGQSVEQNRSQYSQPDIFTRAQAYQLFVTMGALSGRQVAAMERFEAVPGYGAAAASFTGAEVAGNAGGTPTPEASVPITGTTAEVI